MLILAILLSIAAIFELTVFCLLNFGSAELNILEGIVLIVSTLLTVAMVVGILTVWVSAFTGRRSDKVAGLGYLAVELKVQRVFIHTTVKRIKLKCGDSGADKHYPVPLIVCAFAIAVVNILCAGKFIDAVNRVISRLLSIGGIINIVISHVPGDLSAVDMGLLRYLREFVGSPMMFSLWIMLWSLILSLTAVIMIQFISVQKRIMKRLDTEE